MSSLPRSFESLGWGGLRQNLSNKLPSDANATHLRPHFALVRQEEAKKKNGTYLLDWFS